MALGITLDSGAGSHIIPDTSGDTSTHPSHIVTAVLRDHSFIGPSCPWGLAETQHGPHGWSPSNWNVDRVPSGTGEGVSRSCCSGYRRGGCTVGSEFDAAVGEAGWVRLARTRRRFSAVALLHSRRGDGRDRVGTGFSRPRLPGDKDGRQKAIRRPPKPSAHLGVIRRGKQALRRLYGRLRAQVVRVTGPGWGDLRGGT